MNNVFKKLCRTVRIRASQNALIFISYNISSCLLYTSSAKIKKLSEELERHNRSYYVLDNPEISDYEYDMMMRELRQLESEYPEYASENSPTKRVGGEALSTFEKVEHKVQMGSLQDVFSFGEVEDFIRCV